MNPLKAALLGALLVMGLIGAHIGSRRGSSLSFGHLHAAHRAQQAATVAQETNQ